MLDLEEYKDEISWLYWEGRRLCEESETQYEHGLIVMILGDIESPVMKYLYATLELPDVVEATQGVEGGKEELWNRVYDDLVKCRNENGRIVLMANRRERVIHTMKYLAGEEFGITTELLEEIESDPPYESVSVLVIECTYEGSPLRFNESILVPSSLSVQSFPVYDVLSHSEDWDC